LIIQRGKPIQNKVSALEMTNIIQYGADKLFSQNEGDTIKDIEEILDYSINKTEKINSHLKYFILNYLNKICLFNLFTKFLKDINFTLQ